MHEDRTPHIAAAVALLLGLCFIGPLGEFCLDDAWITLSYAKHLRLYGELSYNLGDRETGFSSPLWMILATFFPHPRTSNSLSASQAAASTQTLVLYLKILGVLFHALTAGCTAALAMHIAKARASWEKPVPLASVGLLAGIAVAIHPLLLQSATSGMESSLAAALASAWTLALMSGRQHWSAALAFLLPLARPELLVWVLVVLLFRARFRHPLVEFRPLLAASAGMATHGIYCQVVSGYPLPNPFYVKGAWSLGASLHYLATTYAQHEPWILSITGLLLVAYNFWRRRHCFRHPEWWLLAAWLCSMLAIACSRPLHEGILFFELRYFVPLAFVPALWLGLSLSEVPPKLAVFALAVFGLVCAHQGFETWHRQRLQEHNIAVLHRAPALHIAQSLPSDAVVMVEGAGATRYFAQPEQKIVDFIGLNNKSIAHAGSYRGRVCQALAQGSAYALLPDPFVPSFAKVMALRPLWSKREPTYAQAEGIYPLSITLFKIDKVKPSLCEHFAPLPPSAPRLSGLSPGPDGANRPGRTK